MLDATENRVFESLTQLADRGISAYTDYKKSRVQAEASRPVQASTQSTPSGTNWGIWNPFPGTQGSYPQAEAKGAPVVSVAGMSFSPMLLIGGVILLVIALLMRR